MINRASRLIFKCSSVGFLMFLLVLTAFAELDPNPNSPTPILISQPDSTRALAKSADTFGKRNFLKAPTDAFQLDQKIILYVTNIDLMKGEGENAFRVYVRDSKNRLYRFPVLDLQPVKGQEWIYELKIHLKDDIGFWDRMKADGDVSVYVTWRGLASNETKLGLGKTGGDLKFYKNAEPTPLKMFAQKPKVDENTSEYVGYRFSADRKRFLEQATFGPTDAEDFRLRRIGLRTWLAEQFQLPYPTPTNPYPDLELKPNDINNGCPFVRTTPEYRLCTRTYYSQYPLQTWFFKEAFYGKPQLRHRVAWALHQLWVTSGFDIRQSSHMIAYHQVLSDNAFGNFRDLMKEMTLNPAMGDYLDMARSTANNPNENYAREILQLFTIGLFMLNQDGTLQLDGNNEPIPTYNQTAVDNFTKVFTGFRFCNVGCPNSTPGAVNFKDPLILTQSLHNTEAKTLLDYPNPVNKNIAAGLNGNTELELALDNIFYHPNVAPFVSKFLIQHLVTSDPSPAYIGRVSAVFNNNGSGIRGDLKAVVRAILLDPEARGDEKTDPNYGKLREPVQLTTNIYRHFDVKSADGTQQSDGYVVALPFIMGQFPFYPPTVFNYYPPNYVVPGTTLLAPEFGIMNTGSAIGRTDASTVLAFIALEVDSNNNPPNYPQGSSIDVSSLIPVSQGDPTANALVDALDRKLMHSTMSNEMREKVISAVVAVPSNTVEEHEFRVRTAIFTIASSSQYQIQR